MPLPHARRALICTLILILLSGCASAAPTAVHDDVTRVAATIETAPMPHAGDAANNPAIWVNLADPAQSTIIGTDKQGGLAVYGLDGKQIRICPMAI